MLLVNHRTHYILLSLQTENIKVTFIKTVAEASGQEHLMSNIPSSLLINLGSPTRDYSKSERARVRERACAQRCTLSKLHYT